ncbi:MAG: SAM-dependent methyltransferase [Kangiella sp.]|nr:SAM-dependent methyltransferase [Kangiella sp.]
MSNTNRNLSKEGEFIAVSTGMNLGGQISVIAKDYIQKADIVFALMPHTLAERWLERLNPNVVSLQPYYGVGKYRMQSYEEMIEAMMDEVRKGTRVCGAFYGHAGVFACVPRLTIDKAREEGFRAIMEPGISAEACLYADIGIDPGVHGIQGYEASQFLFYNQSLNNAAYAIMWQIGIVGEHTATQFETRPEWVESFVERLEEWYPSSHEVILYEAAVLPIEMPRIEYLKLKDLPNTEMSTKTTLVIPPIRNLELNIDVLEKMGLKPEDIAHG